MERIFTPPPKRSAHTGKAARLGNRPVVVAVSGVKNSGKTALIEAMLPYLAAAGLYTAIIKHDGHSFLPEPPGTDTGRFMAAGAWGAAIFDGEKCKLVKREQVDEGVLIAQFPEADLILLEGFKHSSWPKLEVVRKGNSDAPVCDPATLLGLVTDLPIDLPGVPRLPFGDAARAAETIVAYAGSFRLTPAERTFNNANFQIFS